MPRTPSLELPNIPMHVTQRGVNRCALLIDDDDRHHFRHLMNKACREAPVALHAFVRMDNHAHLLLRASESGAVSHVTNRGNDGQARIRRRYIGGAASPAGRAGAGQNADLKRTTATSSTTLIW